MSDCIIPSAIVFAFYALIRALTAYDYDPMRDEILKILLAAGTEQLHAILIAERSAGKLKLNGNLYHCLRRMEDESLVGRFEALEPRRPERDHIPRYVYVLTNKGKEAAKRLSS